MKLTPKMQEMKKQFSGKIFSSYTQLDEFFIQAMQEVREEAVEDCIKKLDVDGIKEMTTKQAVQCLSNLLPTNKE